MVLLGYFIFLHLSASPLGVSQDGVELDCIRCRLFSCIPFFLAFRSWFFFLFVFRAHLFISLGPSRFVCDGGLCMLVSLWYDGCLSSPWILGNLRAQEYPFFLPVFYKLSNTSDARVYNHFVFFAQYDNVSFALSRESCSFPSSRARSQLALELWMAIRDPTTFFRFLSGDLTLVLWMFLVVCGRGLFSLWSIPILFYRAVDGLPVSLTVSRRSGRAGRPLPPRPLRSRSGNVLSSFAYTVRSCLALFFRLSSGCVGCLGFAAW